MTRAQKKQINNNKIGQMLVTGFIAAGTSDVVTDELVTAASNDNVTVIPSTGTVGSKGFLVTSSINKVKIVNSTTKSLIADLNSNEIFGRLTEAAGVYTLSYFSIQSGSEVAVSLSETIDFFPHYNYEFKDFPFDSMVRILDNITNVVAQAPSALNIATDTTINQHFDTITADVSSNDIIITLGDLSLGSITKNKTILIIPINTGNGFTATVNGTGGNYSDEGTVLGADLTEEPIQVRGFNDDKWRTIAF